MPATLIAIEAPEAAQGCLWGALEHPRAPHDSFLRASEGTFRTLLLSVLTMPFLLQNTKGSEIQIESILVTVTHMAINHGTYAVEITVTLGSSKSLVISSSQEV